MSGSIAIDPAAVERGRWIFSAWKHLRTFEAAGATVFETTGLAGRAADLLGRMRGLDPYSAKHVLGLVGYAGIGKREFSDTMLPKLEQLGVLQVDRDGANRVNTVRAMVLGEDDVMAQADRLWEALDPEPAERAAIIALREVATAPCTRDEVLAAIMEGGLTEQDARHGIELAEAHALIRSIVLTDFGETFYYNDFLWGQDIKRTTDALAVLPTEQRSALRSLLDELHAHEGRPLDAIESASPQIVEHAVVHGLIERTEIRTLDGKMGTFHFTPRFRGFGIKQSDMPDTLDQIRIVIASVGFASHYAAFKLREPEVFLEKLIERGRSRASTPIGTDYGEMERQKIVDVVQETPGSRFHHFEVVKKDTLTAALDTMRAGTLITPGRATRSGAALMTPQRFVDPVATRLRLGERAGRTDDFDQTLLSRVRDAAQQDRFLP